MLEGLKFFFSRCLPRRAAARAASPPGPPPPPPPLPSTHRRKLPYISAVKLRRRHPPNTPTCDCVLRPAPATPMSDSVDEPPTRAVVQNHLGAVQARLGDYVFSLVRKHSPPAPRTQTQDSPPATNTGPCRRPQQTHIPQTTTCRLRPVVPRRPQAIPRANSKHSFPDRASRRPLRRPHRLAPRLPLLPSRRPPLLFRRLFSRR